MIILPFVFLATAYSSVHARLDVARDVSVTLPVVSELNIARLGSVVQLDQSRAMALKQRLHASGQPHRRQSASVDVTNTAVDFTIEVSIGESATQYTLLLDSGSANTWIGANKTYTPSSTSYNTGESVSVTYGSGKFSGTEYEDKLDLGNGLVIKNQSIGVANSTSGFDGSFDGILGIGPVGLTGGTVSGSSGSIPTVLDNLKSQKSIGVGALGMFYPPYAETTSGSVTFGGADRARYTGPLTYASITKSSPANEYYGIDQSITYGKTEIASMTAGIVDSGTTMILLASDHYNAYVNATGAVLDNGTNMLSLPKDQYDKLQPLNFNIGGKTWALNANAQIWPRSLNTALNGDDDHIYLVVGDLGSESGAGFDFINGYMFMQRFYTVFDSTNSRVGFATTKYTQSEAN